MSNDKPRERSVSGVYAFDTPQPLMAGILGSSSPLNIICPFGNT
ncbi:MAG: hypothetical protein ACYT04_73540 [Nostoc sp.]